MAQRYFFDFHDPRGSVLDQEGRECEDLSRARTNAVESARAIIAEGARTGFIDLTPRIEVRSATGEIVLTVRFSEAVLRVVEP